MYLAGDIGGTNTRLALFDEGEIVKEATFSSRQFQNLEEILEQFLKEKVKKACFGLAGAIHDGVCHATNLPWVVNAREIEKRFRLSKVHLLNDLEANAYGIATLTPEEFFVLQEGAEQKGHAALISAGTGLGEAGLFWDGKKHHPIASEGGHCDFAPRDELEVELFSYLKKKSEHVSYERVVSGPGLYTLFQFLIETGKEALHPEVAKELKEEVPARVIAEWGSQRSDAACARVIDWFISLYGSEAGNLALKFLPVGGLYIGGGIAPHLARQMKQGAFCSSFSNKGRMKAVLETIPIKIIMNDQTALFGAARYAEEH